MKRRKYPRLTCKLCILYHRCKRPCKDKEVCAEYHPSHCRRKMTKVGQGLVRIGETSMEGRLYRCDICDFEMNISFPVN